MMASIEARIRRLNKLAQNTYLSLSTAKQNLNGKISSQPPQPFASPGPPAASDSQLPEWKFFNKVRYCFTIGTLQHFPLF